VDALVLCQHLVATRSHDALQEALMPQPSRRAKHAAAAAAGGGSGLRPGGL
jgi:hypothetical protein